MPAAESKGVSIEATIDPNAGAIRGDADRLQQIAWNLMSNAVKFTGRGGRVTVDVRRVDRDVQITVADSGIGITPAFLPFLFERFRQAESGAQRPVGLGLGLNIARQLVELHGGSITGSSEGAGRGATFRVTLPALAVI
jgi:signal transduction histidine kinase